MAQRSDPISEPPNTCEKCGSNFHRKRFNDRLEDHTGFRRRRFCSRECADRAKLGQGMPAVERMWRFIAKAGPDECWEWKGSRDEKGYGKINRNGRPATVTRVMWEAHFGPLAGAHILVCHSCDNPSCVNPSHLFLGSHADNTRDMMRKKRHRYGRNPNPPPPMRGEDHAGAKVTWAEVDLIRTSPLSGAELARCLGLNRSTVNRIRRGGAWSSASRPAPTVSRA